MSSTSLSCPRLYQDAAKAWSMCSPTRSTRSRCSSPLHFLCSFFFFLLTRFYKPTRSDGSDSHVCAAQFTQTRLTSSIFISPDRHDLCSIHHFSAETSIPAQVFDSKECTIIDRFTLFLSGRGRSPKNDPLKTVTLFRQGLSYCQKKKKSSWDILPYEVEVTFCDFCSCVVQYSS